MAMTIRVPPAEQIKTYMRVADGRDKAIKIAQYFLKVLLAWQYVTKKGTPEMHARVSAVASNFSKTRKTLRLMHFVEPWIALRDTVAAGEVPTVAGLLGRDKSALAQLPPRQRIMEGLAFVNTVVEIANDVVDDIVCLSKIGALDKKWSDRFDMLSSKLWMVSIVIDMLDNFAGMQKMVQDLIKKEAQARAARVMPASKPPKVNGEISKPNGANKAASNGQGDANAASEQAEAAVVAQREKLFLQRISFIKLLCDFSFNWVDVFEVSGKRAEQLQAAAGMSAALISAYKLWLKAK